jgi:hypothetical protein
VGGNGHWIRPREEESQEFFDHAEEIYRPEISMDTVKDHKVAMLLD